VANANPGSMRPEKSLQIFVVYDLIQRSARRGFGVGFRFSEPSCLEATAKTLHIDTCGN